MVQNPHPMHITGIIPARHASTRLPGKPLADIGGTSMIMRVYERAKQAACLNELLVATDDERIYEHVELAGGKAVMTGLAQSGTERCALTLQQFRKPTNAVINIQGDEPFIEPEQIDSVGELLLRPEVGIATLARQITQPDVLGNHNRPKLVMDLWGRVLYFSRQCIPHPDFEKGGQAVHYQHIGIYGYKTEILLAIAKLPPSPLEQAERLEQLRWLENGHAIHAATTPYESLSIDTPHDLEAARKLVGESGN